MAAVLLNILFIDAKPGGDLADMRHRRFLGDFNVGFVIQFLGFFSASSSIKRS
jgi:hypothetical protein